MAEFQLIKQPGGLLRAANESDAERLNKIKNGRLITADIVQVRNPAFHRKFFALLNFAYEYWEPPVLEYKGLKSEKSFERFRKEVTVLAGHYTVTTDLRGNVKLEPKSISFASMDDTEFEQLYRDVFEILWKFVLSRVEGMTRDAAEHAMLELLRFDA